MRRPSTERGFALLVTISLLLVLALMALSLSSTARLRSASLRNNADLLVARSLAEAALDLAKLDLSRPVEDRQFGRDGREHAIALQGGTASFAIEDESGKLDLNHQPRDHVASLIGRMAGRSGTTVSAGAVADRIRAAAPRSLADLATVPGLTPGLVAALAPHITVHAAGTRINIDNATEDVLLSLPGLTPGLVAQVMQSRRQGVPRPSLGAGEMYATNESGPVYTVVAVGRAESGIEARLTEVVLTTGRSLASNRVGVRVMERR